jgi:hypothetical protein
MTLFMTCVKKIIFRAPNSFSRDLCVCVSYKPINNTLFRTNFVCEHSMSRCTSKNLLSDFFSTFWNAFRMHFLIIDAFGPISKKHHVSCMLTTMYYFMTNLVDGEISFSQTFFKQFDWICLKSFNIKNISVSKS